MKSYDFVGKALSFETTFIIYDRKNKKHKYPGMVPGRINFVYYCLALGPLYW